jgi:hypothetical protein
MWDVENYITTQQRHAPQGRPAPGVLGHPSASLCGHDPFAISRQSGQSERVSDDAMYVPAPVIASPVAAAHDEAVTRAERLGAAKRNINDKVTSASRSDLTATPESSVGPVDRLANCGMHR